MARRHLPRIWRTTQWSLWGIALCAGAGAEVLPTTHPSTLPARPASTRPEVMKKIVVKPLPKEFELLMTRSIFARRRGPGQGGLDAAAEAQAARDRGLVLRGVADQSGQRTALLEDTSSGKTKQLHVGDEALGGRIVAITMEGLDRNFGGQLVHVGVGQSLDGKGEPPGPTTRQSIARDDGVPITPDPAGGRAIPAGAKILEVKQ